MCEKASIQVNDIRELCRNNIAGQRSAIDQMKFMLKQ